MLAASQSQPPRVQLQLTKQAPTQTPPQYHAVLLAAVPLLAVQLAAVPLKVVQLKVAVRLHAVLLHAVQLLAVPLLAVLLLSNSVKLKHCGPAITLVVAGLFVS